MTARRAAGRRAYLEDMRETAYPNGATVIRPESAICLRPAGVRTGSRVTHSKRGPIAGERTCLRAHKQAPERVRDGVSRVCQLVGPPLLLMIQPRARQQSG